MAKTIFFGEPNKLISKYQKNKRPRLKRLFRFDKNGEFTTDNPKLIKYLKLKKFEFIERDYDSMDYNELRSVAKFSTHKMTKKEIRAKLKAGD